MGTRKNFFQGGGKAIQASRVPWTRFCRRRVVRGTEKVVLTTAEYRSLEERREHPIRVVQGGAPAENRYTVLASQNISRETTGLGNHIKQTRKSLCFIPVRLQMELSTLGRPIYC